MTQKYQIVSKSQTVTSNTTLMPEGFGGWYAQNIGQSTVKVDGFSLEPGASLDFSTLAPNVIWNSPITIEFPAMQTTVGSVRVIRLKYNIING